MDETVNIKKGDILKVYQKIIEGKRERLASFTGRVMQTNGTGVNLMVTLRAMMDGVEVDRIYPWHSPAIAKFEKIVEKKSTEKKKSSRKPKKSSKK